MIVEEFPGEISERFFGKTSGVISGSFSVGITGGTSEVTSLESPGEFFGLSQK